MKASFGGDSFKFFKIHEKINYIKNNVKKSYMIFWLHCAIVHCAQLIEILSARVSIYEKFILKYCQIVADHLEKSIGTKI